MADTGMDWALADWATLLAGAVVVFVARDPEFDGRFHEALGDLAP